MTAFVLRMEEKIVDFYKNYIRYILGGLLVGVLTYFMMMSLNLVNDLDGIWHPSNFIAGDWEISLGRGLQRYADRARFGIVSDPFNSVLTILLIATANAIIIKQFQFHNFIYEYLVVTIMVANPVVCNSLSYSYMSVNFGLAYLFSVLAFNRLKSTMDHKKLVIGVLIGGVCLGVSMAFYQAYISVTSVLIAIYILKILMEGEKTREVLRYFISCACMVVLGGGFYFGIAKALLYRADVQMASYKGASEVSLLSMIKNLPNSLKRCYLEFGEYFGTYKAMADLEFIEIVLAGLFLIYLTAVLMRFCKLFRDNPVNAALFAVMVALLPVASCFILMIAVGNTMSGLMSMGLVLCVVMLGVMIPREGRGAFWMKRVYLVVLAAFAWFQLSAVVNDQLALKEGKTATITLTENIVTQLYGEGYLEEYQTVALVGRPANNHRFTQSTAYQMANEYAKFGCWSTDARNNKVSWEGVLSNFLGVNLSLCGEAEYREIVALEQVAEMPEFPAEGSICVIRDVVVVKVSELY